MNPSPPSSEMKRLAPIVLYACLCVALAAVGIDALRASAQTPLPAATQPAWATPVNGVIQLPPGATTLSSTLTLPAGCIELRGSGADVPQHGPQSGSLLIYTARDGSDAIVASPGSARAYLHDFALQIGDGNASLNTSLFATGKPLGTGNGIHLTSRHHSTIERVNVAGFDKAGILIDNSYWASVRDCVCWENGVGIEGNLAACARIQNIRADYNLIGLHNLDCDGVTCEDCRTAGILYDYQFGRFALRNYHGEQNPIDLNIAGEIFLNVDGSNYYSSGAVTKPNINVQVNGQSVVKFSGVSRNWQASASIKPLVLSNHATVIDQQIPTPWDGCSVGSFAGVARDAGSSYGH